MSNPFPVTENLIHLNHAAVGVWPQATTDVVKAFAEENARQGTKNYPHWIQVEKNLREKIRQLINAQSTDEIALVKNTSEGLSFIATGVRWKTGENVVGIQQEFPSNRFVWDALADRGVEFRKLDMHQTDDPEQALFDLCDSKTRLVSVSAVQYASGFRMDLPRIGDFCRANGILFCVDAIQQIGMLPFDVQAIGADFAVADGHKWMLAAEGLGLLYVRANLLDQLEVSQYGWHMASLNNYTQQAFELYPGARRFECGSPNMLGIHALDASLGVLLNEGMQTIGSRVLELADHLTDGLKQINGVQVLSSEERHRKSAIVTFVHDRFDTESLYRYLQQHDVLCAPRGGGIRLSPHYYIPPEQIDKCTKLIKGFEG